MSDIARLVVFRGSLSGANGSLHPENEQNGNGPSLEYLRSREMAERAAAKHARSLAARHVHQELAQHYAELVRQAAAQAVPPVPVLASTQSA